MFAEDIILQPVLTEKGYDGIASKRYTFIVKKDANKTEIKAAVEKLFGVKVASVNTLKSKGKLKRMVRYGINKYKKRFMNLNHCCSHCYV